MGVGIGSSWFCTRSFVLVTSSLVWSAVVVLGLKSSMDWELTSGQSTLERQFPLKSSPRPRLDVVLHSQCPCSLATIQNLITWKWVRSHKPVIHLILTGPDSARSSIARRAKLVADAEIEHMDSKEVVTKYGALTSGQCYLFDKQGSLRFAGGITDRRGQDGASRGLDQIERLLEFDLGYSTTPVFGCGLRDPEKKL